LIASAHGKKGGVSGNRRRKKTTCRPDRVIVSPHFQGEIMKPFQAGLAASLLSVSLSFALAGCGGGSDHDSETVVTPQPDPVVPGPSTGPATPVDPTVPTTPTTPTDPTSPTTPTTPTTPAVPEGFVSRTVRVVDGPLQSTRVCADVNGDRQCSGDENSALTDASGHATILIPAALADSAPLLAMVTRDSVDRDSGPVGQPYTLTTPAGWPLITPASTLVQVYMAAYGGTAQEAKLAIEALITEGGSNFETYLDYADLPDDDGRRERNFARLLTVIRQTLLSVAGDTFDSAEAIDRTLLRLLPQILKLAVSPAVLNAPTPEQREAVFKESALQLANASGITRENIDEIIRRYKSLPVSTVDGVLVSLQYIDQNNYVLRTFLQTGLQAIPDAGGKTYFTDGGRRLRLNEFSSQLENWGGGYNRNATYWTGSGWFACPDDHVHQRTRLANGADEVVYCNAPAYQESTWEQDISGMTFASLERTFGTDTEVPRGRIIWTPNKIPEAAQFPAGSVAYFTESRKLAGVTRFNPLQSPKVLSNVPDYCGDNPEVEPRAPAVNLERILGRNGTPCVIGPNLGNFDFSVVPLTYNDSGRTDNRLAAAFRGIDSVIYYTCDFSSKCTEIPVRGNYTIESLGQARVLRMTNLPAAVADVVLVQYENQVYYGNSSLPYTGTKFLLNGVARDALLTGLDIGL
jgi:hypothetical protein